MTFLRLASLHLLNLGSLYSPSRQKSQVHSTMADTTEPPAATSSNKTLFNAHKGYSVSQNSHKASSATTANKYFWFEPKIRPTGRAMVAAASIMTTPFLTLNPDLPDVWVRCPPNHVLDPETMEHRRLVQVGFQHPKFQHIDPSNLERVVPVDRSCGNVTNGTNGTTSTKVLLKRKASRELLGHENTKPVFNRNPPSKWAAVRPEQVRRASEALQNALATNTHPDEGLGSASSATQGDGQVEAPKSVSRFVSPITPEGTPKPGRKRKEVSQSPRNLRSSKRVKPVEKAEDDSSSRRTTRSGAGKQRNQK
ncbi:hypothetical protein EDC01DRAFT_339621 [Geopyxis carbonaria]|nr:hypothetical protein EDC01DRAFT_339621 [Geopyxis carbonaria]